MLIFDAHADTLEKMIDYKTTLQDSSLQFNIKNVVLPHIQCLSIFTKENSLENLIRAKKMLEVFFIEYAKGGIQLLKNKGERLEQKRLGVILTIENSSIFEDDFSLLEYFINAGVRSISLTWNFDNKLACGAFTKNDTGLTRRGREFLKYLDRRNIILDLAHASKKTFYEAGLLYEGRVIVSHACVDEIRRHKRNLDNNQIEFIKEKQGVIGVCFYKDFLTDKGNATLKDVINHIKYICDLIGEDYVGFGSDFDGATNFPDDVSKVEEIYQISNALKDMKKESIEKILGGNFKRVF